MRTWPFLPGMIALALVSAARAEDCNNAPDQTRMNECAARSYKLADHELNLLYQQMLGRLKEDADAGETRKALIAAQRAWIAFRDAECAFVGSGTAGGSINSTIVSSCLTDLTKLRIKDFKVYLDCKEGDLSCPLPPKP